MSDIVAFDLVYRVGDATLVDQVSLEGDAGSLLAIIGPNGAGKSTLLRLLGGDLAPSAGSALLLGQTVAGLSPDDLSRLRAVLPQRPPSDIPFAARAVVALGRHPHRRDPEASAERDAAMVTRAMEETDTVYLAHRVVATLSGGEQSRVALARVLAQETPVVLLDEPTAGLDVAHEERVMEVLVRLAADGKAVAAVLHDLNAAAAYATNVALMDGGIVRAYGPPGDVLQEKLLSEVYRRPMRVLPHPFRNCPLVLPA